MPKSPGLPLALRRQDSDLGALVGRIVAGDENALAGLYDRTCASVYGLALRILGDKFAAEEATLDVYLQVARRAAVYDPERGSALAWLLMLTRSRAIDRLRAESQARQREVPVEAASAAPSPDPDPEEQSAVAEVQQVVTTALGVLTAEQRQVIELAYYSGFTQREIAARLGLPLGTVKTRIRTGMSVLRRQLTPILGEGHP